MNVEIKNNSNKLIWSYGIVNDQPQGVDNRSYANDGTQEKIVEALELALYQAKAVLSLYNSYRVLDSGSSTSQIENNVPVS